jgi:spore coat polysaccharide biosynthesis predicted glycosyltransferase SpsG/CMP-N-acetylneuraminic acid synthetase
MTNHNTLCIIPARGTSSGLPKKNFKQIDGKPLVGYTIESAIRSSEVDDIIVSTESEELAKIARDYGATVPFIRPPELSEPDVVLNEVLNHAISEFKKSDRYDVANSVIVVLQPNVPFTRAADIDEAVQKYRAHDNRAIISVVEEREFFWEATNEHLEPYHLERTLRSELEPLYRETGSIYVTNKPILENGDRVGANPSYIVTDKISAFEIESLFDLWLAEKIKEGPTILFRVNGGGEIGMGHIYRCLRLAEELQNVLECEILFLSDREYEDGINKIRSQGFDVLTTDGSENIGRIENIDPDIIFLDVLDTDGQFVRALHQVSAAIINLEDLGDGMTHADYVVNALYEEPVESDNQFSGSDYFVLRGKLIDESITVTKNVKKVLLTFGGTDPTNISTRAVEELGSAGLGYNYRLVLGPGFELEDSLQNLPDEILSKFEIYRDVTAMAEMMQWADIAICSGGRTAYELAAVGVPSIVIAHNEREASRMRELASLNIVDFLGRNDELEKNSLTERLVQLDEDYERRQQMSEKGQEFVDGGGTRRILDIVHDIMIG